MWKGKSNSKNIGEVKWPELKFVWSFKREDINCPGETLKPRRQSLHFCTAGFISCIFRLNHSVCIGMALLFQNCLCNSTQANWVRHRDMIEITSLSSCLSILSPLCILTTTLSFKVKIDPTFSWFTFLCLETHCLSYSLVSLLAATVNTEQWIFWPTAQPNTFLLLL